MRIYISHPKLEKAIIVPPTYLGYLTSEMVLEHIDNVLYSAGEIPADESLEINAGIVTLIQGNGRKPIINLERDIESKRSFVHIKSTDNSCVPRAIIIGYWHLLESSVVLWLHSILNELFTLSQFKKRNRFYRFGTHFSESECDGTFAFAVRPLSERQGTWVLKHGNLMYVTTYATW